VALHGGGEYVTGDEAAMDALLGAAINAAGARVPRIVLVPTAVARHRPDLAVAHGERAFREAAGRAGVEVRVTAARLLERTDADNPGRAVVATLEGADLVHLPGGDPDLIPAVLRGTAAWEAILRAYAGGACVAGASAGAMALAERLWTRDGPVDGLGLVPGIAVLPHFAAERLEAWRAAVDGTMDRAIGVRPLLTWLGLDEQTLVIGRPGDTWTVAGRGRAHVVPTGVSAPGTPATARTAGPGDRLTLE
jgi:cyanophycinase